MNIGHVQNYKIINCSWKINVLVLIRAYWWENWSEINKRTGTFIRNSRVVIMWIKKKKSTVVLLCYDTASQMTPGIVDVNYDSDPWFTSKKRNRL